MLQSKSPRNDLPIRFDVRHMHIPTLNHANMCTHYDRPAYCETPGFPGGAPERFFEKNGRIFPSIRSGTRSA
jgi:hypothetical protein